MTRLQRLAAILIPSNRVHVLLKPSRNRGELRVSYDDLFDQKTLGVVGADSHAVAVHA